MLRNELSMYLLLIPSIELQTELRTDSLARKSAKMLKSALVFNMGLKKKNVSVL